MEPAQRFVIKGPLGRGGMGRVVLAHDRALSRDVALKLVPFGRDPVQLQRFAREGEVAASLDHPGIVRVHSAGALGAEAFLAYELVEGARPLDEAWEGAPRRARLRWVLEAARALEHAHARGVVHRDVKPGNVLVDAAGRARLTDFGLARATGLTPLTREGALMGTLFWLAPEALDGRTLGPQADVWALGVVLYQALTDQLPFRGSTLPEVGARIATARPTPPRELDPSVPPALEALCLRALEKNPAARPADGGAFAAQLEAALAGRGPSARRGPLLLGGLGLLAVTSAASAALLLRGGAGAGEPDPTAPRARTRTAEPPPPPPLAWNPAPGARAASLLRLELQRRTVRGDDPTTAYQLDLHLQETGLDVSPARIERRLRLRRLRGDTDLGPGVSADSAGPGADPALAYFLDRAFRVVQDRRSGGVLQVEGLSDLRDEALARTVAQRTPGVLEAITAPLTDDVLQAHLDVLWGGLPPQGLAAGQEAWQVPRQLYPWGGKWLSFTGAARREGDEVTCAPAGEVRERSTQESVLLEPRIALWQRWGPQGVEAARAELRVRERWPGGEAEIEWRVEWGPEEER